MIICNLIGGLGNQMFQYACGTALSIRTKQPLRIAVDQFENYRLHNGFELQRVFGINTPLATDMELKEMLRWKSSPRLRYLFGRPSMRWANSKPWCVEPHFHFWPDFSHCRGMAYLHGYWQSELYFRDIEDQIRECFQFHEPWDEPNLEVRSKMKEQPSASLHVRRGDYVSSKNQGIYAQCNLDYYRNAISLLKEMVPNIRIFAFSDDPNWVKHNLLPKFDAIEIISHNLGERSANDMRLMCLADHHIIANSSFSWWGAWLNPNQKKIVIAPKQWFTDGRNDKDLIPYTWLRV